MPEDILISNEELTVAVSPLGAEMRRVTDARGAERLWNGDPAYWKGRAPVLFPYAGGLIGDSLVHEGRTYEGCPKHGFARFCEFSLGTVKKDEASFTLTEKNENYPFDYAFTVRYALEGKSILVDYTCLNTGSKPLYYSVGCHEAYSAPGGIEHYRLAFPEEESFLCSPVIGSQISHDAFPAAPKGKTLPLKEEQFTIDAMVFLGLKSRKARLENDLNGDWVEVSYEGFPYLLVWKVPKAPYVCIEPWVNPPAFTDGTAVFRDREGIQCLGPGEQRTHRHVITFS